MLKNISLRIIALLLTASAFPAAAEDGVTDSTILIGQTVGLTGTVAGPVKEVNEGALAYLKVVNNEGGVNGRKIELRTLDDKFDPALTLANAEILISKDRVFALFQGRGTPHVKGIMSLLAAKKVPLLAPSTGSSILHAPVHPMLFNVRAKYHDEIIKGVQHFTTSGIKQIGLLHVDDAFGLDGLEGFNKAMDKGGLKPAIIAKFDRVKPDYAASADTIIKANPQALIIASSSKNTVEVIKAIREQGGQMQIMTLSNNSSASFVKDLGPAGAGILVTQVTPAPSHGSSQIVQEFKSAAEASGATKSYAAMEGYINAKVMVEALRRAGRNLTREGYVKALESMQKVDLGVYISYSPLDHTGSDFVDLTMISRDGRFIR